MAHQRPPMKRMFGERETLAARTLRKVSPEWETGRCAVGGGIANILKGGDTSGGWEGFAIRGPAGGQEDGQVSRNQPVPSGADSGDFWNSRVFLVKNNVILKIRGPSSISQLAVALRFLICKMEVYPHTHNERMWVFRGSTWNCCSPHHFSCLARWTCSKTPRLWEHLNFVDSNCFSLPGCWNYSSLFLIIKF